MCVCDVFSVWWHMTTVLFVLGTLCTTMVMLVVKTNTEGADLTLPPTLQELMLMMSCVSGKDSTDNY